MNPDTTIRVGDRVKIKQVSSGYATTHIGRTAVVKRIEPGQPLYDAYDPWARYRSTGVTRYLVECEGVRREQVYATRVEKIQEPTFSVGDRVIIREGYSDGINSTVVGRIGTITGINHGGIRTLYFVRTPESSANKARRVELVEDVPNYDAPTAAVGDRVVITKQNNAGEDHTGRVGVVAKIADPYKIGGTITPRLYDVKVPGVIQTVQARKVTKVSPVDLNEISVGDTVRFLEGWTSGTLSARAGGIGRVIDIQLRGGDLQYTVDLPRFGASLARKVEKADPVQVPAAPQVAASPESPEILVDLQRVQAAQAAHSLFGNDASLDQLIGTAEFILRERTVGTETTGTVRLPELRTVTGAPAVRPARPADVEIHDKDGDRLTLEAIGDRRREDGEVVLTVNSQAVYLTGSDLDAAITFLTQARDHIRKA